MMDYDYTEVVNLEPTPNPGSTLALKLGCTCPVLDNNYGAGAYNIYGDCITYWINNNCPLHSPQRNLV